MKEYEIKKYSFKVLEKEGVDGVHETIIKFIKDTENDATLSYDFVVCENNPSKNSFNKNAANTAVDIIKQSNMNVFFDH